MNPITRLFRWLNSPPSHVETAAEIAARRQAEKRAREAFVRLCEREIDRPGGNVVRFFGRHWLRREAAKRDAARRRAAAEFWGGGPAA